MHLLQRVEKHLRRSGVPQSRFGREALGDPRLVTDLRKGRELRPKTAQRVQAYLDAHERETRQ